MDNNEINDNEIKENEIKDNVTNNVNSEDINNTETNNNEDSDITFELLVIIVSLIAAFLTKSIILFIGLMIIAYYTKGEFFKILGKIMLYILIVIAIVYGFCFLLIGGF